MTPARALSSLVLLAAFAVTGIGCKKGVGGECDLNKDCADKLVCLAEGPGPWKCMALDDAKERCASTKLCKNNGLCSVSSVAAASVGVCVAKSDEDCEGSKGCKNDGRCRRRENGDCGE